MSRVPWCAVVLLAGCGYDEVVLGARPDLGAAGAGGAEPVVPVAASLSAGQAHTCSSRGGTLWCWGDDTGTGSSARLAPASLEPTSGFAAIAAGERHTCALRSTTVWCWGSADLGQLGLGDTLPRSTPTLVGSLSAVTALGVGYTHACAVTSQGSLWCWGSNTWGELGQDPLGTSFAAPVQIGTDGDWTTVTGGQYHTCGLRRSGSIWCWGCNNDGRLGLGFASDTPTLAPAQVGSDTDWVSLDGGQNDTCALRADGTLWCWGPNGIDFAPVMVPTQIGTDRDWIAVSTDAFSRCAIKADHSLWCWGRNVEGQLGLGDTTDRTVPTRVAEPALWNAVSVGRFHVCGLDDRHEVWCAGENQSGQLGQGDQERRAVMTRVPLP